MPAKKKPANLPSPEVIMAMQRAVDGPQFYRKAYDAFDDGQLPAGLPDGMPRPVVRQLRQVEAAPEYPLRVMVSPTGAPRDVVSVPAAGPLPEQQHNDYYGALMEFWRKAREDRGQQF
jgi:hypothetical protein